MKQVIQYLNKPQVSLIDVPKPKLQADRILIKTNLSLISSGTERMLNEFAKSNLLEKVRQQPEKVQEVLNKINTDGIFPTLEAVSSKMDKPLQMGYCNVGTVLEVGSNCTNNFSIGDRVVSNGPHAEIISTTKNLCALIPNDVSDEQAVFTVLGSIGLNGVRLINPSIGETFLVSGLGLIGLLTCQILKANGCNVLGLDPDESKCSLAESFGVITNHKVDEDLDYWVKSNTQNIGVDGALITASTKSSSPITKAANACRKKGRIIMIGSTGMTFNRNDFYSKELSFGVSCSYGPGRYDDNYELQGNDYPIGYVRWTEKRNFEAILNLLNKNHINTEKLISSKYSINDAVQAYQSLNLDNSNLGILLHYPNQIKDGVSKISHNINFTLRDEETIKYNSNLSLSFIGSGNYASRILIPAFKRNNFNLNTLSANSGVDIVHYGKKFGFEYSSTNIKEVIDNQKVSTIVIATRHDSHAELIINSLIAGKNVFVEKPLCINFSQLEKIKNIYNEILLSRKNQLLMIGFNRRFSPLINKLKSKIAQKNANCSFIYTINAGKLEHDNWQLNKEIGGGRLIGEVCHFLDLLRYLASSRIKSIWKIDLNKDKDCFTLNVQFENGSIGSIHYFSNGSKRYPKERLEVFCEGEIFCLNNFKNLEYWSNLSKYKKTKLLKQNKGHNECVKAFQEAIKNDLKSPIPIDQIFEVQEKLLECSA